MAAKNLCAGAWPGELIFDSKLTTYAHLARLEELQIHFITLRRRGPRLLAAIAATPPADWQRLTPTTVGRAPPPGPAAPPAGGRPPPPRPLPTGSGSP